MIGSSLISRYTEERWPSLEVSGFSKSEWTFLALFYVATFALSAYYFTHDPRAEKFLYPLVVPVLLLLLKKRLFFPILLITVQISFAFLAIGNAELVFKVTLGSFLTLLALGNYTWGFYGFITAQYFYFIPSYYGYTAEHLLIVACILGMLARKQEKIEVIDRSNPLNNFLMIFLIWISAGAIWGPTFEDVFIRYFDLAISIYVVFRVTLQIVDREDRLVTSFKVWAISGFVIAFVLVVIPESSSSGTGSEVDLHKNWSSSLLNFAIFAVLGLLSLREKIYMWLLMYFMLFTMFLINIVLGSRAGLGCLGVYVLVYLLVQNPHKSVWKRCFLRFTHYILILYLVAQIFLVPLLYVNLFNMTRAVPFPKSLSTIVFRFEQWDFARQIIEDEGNYWVGAGMDAYSTYYQNYYESQFGTRQETKYTTPHSLYVAVYVNYGVIGLTLFILCLIVFFNMMKNHILGTKNDRLRIISLVIYSSVASYMLHSFFDWSLLDRRLWMFLGLGVASIVVDRRLNSSKAADDADGSAQLLTSDMSMN
ncbi:MAG: O-antigen ligase family protein [FCB group bacterium]|nr:O-antigen ligase family protein [FCB group bacterium]